MALFDSPVICEYLDSLNTGRKLFPAAGPARWAALRQQAVADGILDWLDFRFGADDWRIGRPALAAWFAGFSQRPSMQATLPSA